MNGLNVPDSLAYGGWGGRFKMERTAGIRGMDFIENQVRVRKFMIPILCMLVRPRVLLPLINGDSIF